MIYLTVLASLEAMWRLLTPHRLVCRHSQLLIVPCREGGCGTTKTAETAWPSSDTLFNAGRVSATVA